MGIITYAVQIVLTCFIIMLLYLFNKDYITNDEKLKQILKNDVTYVTKNQNLKHYLIDEEVFEEEKRKTKRELGL